MALVPETKQGIVDFYVVHASPWDTNKAAIGLTAAQITDLQAKIAAAQAKMLAAQQVREESLAATRALDQAIKDLSKAGSVLITAIRATAEGSADPTNVYNLAQIPPPATPTPAPVPDAPEMLQPQIDSYGSIVLRWKGTLAYSTFFNVYRKLGTSGSWQNLGAVGSKSFTDAGVPGGTAVVCYYVTAQRGLLVSPNSLMVTITFGAGGAQDASIVLKAA